MVPTATNPYIVPAIQPDEVFDPTGLITILGEPSWYRSSIVVSLCEQPSPGEFVVDTNWGAATGHTDTHLLVRPWLLQPGGNSVVPGGTPYPLLRTEFTQRVPLEFADPEGCVLYGKTELTAFWDIPQELEPGAIQVISAESKKQLPQLSGPGKILCYTDTGAWITVWKDEKYQRVPSK